MKTATRINTTFEPTIESYSIEEFVCKRADDRELGKVHYLLIVNGVRCAEFDSREKALELVRE